MTTVPAVGLHIKIAQIEMGRKDKADKWEENLSIADKGLYNRRTDSHWGGLIDQFVINT